MGICHSLAQVDDKLTELDDKIQLNAFKSYYVPHNESVIISCYFNPTHSEYRKKLFFEFYETIKFCHHRIIECVFGDEPFSLPSGNPYIHQVRTDVVLWHKECLLNIIIKNLPKKFKYVFWLDCDLKFTNKNWIVDSVAKLSDRSQSCRILQPFEYAFHLEQNETEPNEETQSQKQFAPFPMNPRANRRVWKSFGSSVEKHLNWQSLDYDLHGHVGFAWGIQRRIFDQMIRSGFEPLYEKALIGG